MAASRLFDELATREFIIVSGKGGVGRTTFAAMVGLSVAERGRRVLVATTGHDDRLGWMLGADGLTSSPVAVADRLWVQRLTPRVCIREYGALVLRSARVADAVFDNRIVRRLLGAIPGLDDFAVLGKAWHEAARGESFDTVVFDGPATGHLRYTLGVPQAILRTISSGPLINEAQRMRQTLTDPTKTQAVLVGLPERWPLAELAELGAALRREIQVDIPALVVNALWPDALADLGDPAVDPSIDPAVAPVLARLGEVGRIGAQQRQEVDAWLGDQAAEHALPPTIGRLPWRWAGACHERDLRALLGAMTESHSGAA